MKARFVCLANSRKYNERCIAGIELREKSDGNYAVIKDGEIPKWIRPVSTCDHGEVPESQVSGISICDIVEIEIKNTCPNSFQTENVHYSSLKKVGSIALKNSNLNHFADKIHPKIFGNKGRAVCRDVIDDIDYSLMLLKPDSFEIKEQEYDEQDDIQLRGVFDYKGFKYNLPITDLSFLERYPKNNTLLSNLFLTISLGGEFRGWHYKLIAGIIITKE